ncbi:MAG: WG repeat-containing protein [Campylobacteraceae bacterium]|jgi:hypothetical protein|nr:WG repeat-containing protein [Campylobacteraceae bacterium]
MRKIIQLIIFAAAICFLDGCMGKIKPFSLNNQWGYMNDNGEVVIEPQFENAFAFADGFAVVKKEGKYGFINRKGKFALPLPFDYIGSFSQSGFAAFKQGNKYGIVDTKGDIVVNAEFDFVGIFAQNGLAAFQKEGKYGYINAAGDIVIEPRFAAADLFTKNGLARVGVDDEKGWMKDGFINSLGRFVIAPQFDFAFSFSDDGLAKVKKGRDWGYINEKGEFVFLTDTICGVDVLKNPQGEITYPKKSAEEICAEAKSN